MKKESKLFFFHKIGRLVASFFKILFYLALAAALLLLAVNGYVCISAHSFIQPANKVQTADAILVLGCGVNGYTPSPMLQERLDTAVSLYQSGAAKKILMSGDHGEQYYNEVGVMKAYAMAKGVDSADIFMDHAGFSTYESLYRAKEVFGCNSLLVVTQKYHLYRTLYIGRQLDLSVTGVAADKTRYAGQFYRDVREIIARDKDFLTVLIKPIPSSVKGESTPITGDGNQTNDAAFEQILKKTDF